MSSRFYVGREVMTKSRKEAGSDAPEQRYTGRIVGIGTTRQLGCEESERADELATAHVNGEIESDENWFSRATKETIIGYKVEIHNVGYMFFKPDELTPIGSHCDLHE